MKRKSIYGLIAGALVLTGISSCDNEKFLEVSHGNVIPSEAIFASDDAALATLTGCYDLMLPSQTTDFAGNEVHNSDPYKPYVFTTSHPTMDSQASGWDAAFCRQGWNAQTTELLSGWRHAYAAIGRCNEYLAGLATAEGLSDAVKKTCEGECLALRSYQYFWLATTFGRVPLLEAGETYVNTPAKARAESYEVMWDFIIEDFKKATELLAWLPFQNEYGRATKGMAEAYLADSYMWKAYRCPDKAAECYGLAKAALKDVLENGPYELNRSFTTLYDADEAWGKEAIWQAILNEGDQWGGWDGSKWSGAHGWTGFYYGAPANGAWGTYACSYELYDAYEDGDKRRDGSLVCATLPKSELERYGKLRWQQTFKPEAWILNKANKDHMGKGTVDFKDEANNKILYDPECPIGFNPFAQEFVGYNTCHREKGDIQPTVYSTKHWRNGRGTHWQGDQWLPDHIYMKRLANVMLDYAECCFRTGEEDKGWEQINKLRERAWGLNEDGHEKELATKFNSYFTKLKDFYKEADNGFGQYSLPENAKDNGWYPIPFGSKGNKPEDAKTYYTKLKAEKGFASEVWKVAVNEERRKELNAEWSLKTDMQKSDYLADHIEHNYPKGYGHETGIEQIYEWRTYRGFDFDDRKMDMPIPQDELIKNPLCDQNDAYK